MKPKRIKLTKLSANHNKCIKQGETRTGYMYSPPTVGERFEIYICEETNGKLFSTSPVKNCTFGTKDIRDSKPVDIYIFQTGNSIYEYYHLDEESEDKTATDICPIHVGHPVIGCKACDALARHKELLELDEKYAITKDSAPMEVCTRLDIENLLRALRDYNFLNGHIVMLMSDCLKIDCEKLCEHLKIDYK